MASVRPLNMKGRLFGQLKKDLALGVLFLSAIGGSWWYFVGLRNIRGYREFYKDYDAEAVAATITPSWQQEDSEEGDD